MFLKTISLSALAASVLLCLPATSEAQFGLRVGSGYAGPYYGGGYGYGNRGYARSYGSPISGGYGYGYGGGLSMGIGNRGYGSYSNGYYNNSYYTNSYYSNGYYSSSPGVIYAQPRALSGAGYRPMIIRR